VASGVDCLHECKEDVNCAWFTYTGNDKVCSLFLDCNDFDTTSCSSCLSARKQCEEPSQSDQGKDWNRIVEALNPEIVFKFMRNSISSNIHFMP